MSKRKSRANTFMVGKSDMIFEDDSSDPEANFNLKPSKTSSATSIASKASGSRVSARGKREKKIYDPSDHSGPVHKKKKEAEAQLAAKKTPSKIQAVKTPVKTPGKPELPPKSPKPTPQIVKRKLDMDKPLTVEKPQEKIQKILVQVPSKEPFKPLQTLRIVPKGILQKSTDSPDKIITALPLPIHVASANVSKWSSKDVANYFEQEGFERKDSNQFVAEEIDGQSLLLLQRDDLMRLKLTVGTAVKMWNRVLKLQTGKNDPTMGWK